MTDTAAAHAARIRGWCVTDGLQVTDDVRSGHPVVAFAVEGQRFDVNVAFTDIKAVLRHELSVPLDALTLNFPGSEGVELATFEELFNRMITNRWGPVTGSVRREPTHWYIALECCCYLEDLSRTVFMAALTEVIKTRRVLDTLVRDMATQRDALRKLDSATRTASPATTAPIGAAVSAGQNAPPASTQQWRPTHTAGAHAHAWPQPDGSTPSTSRLDPGLEVMVIETRGEWAHVLCSNAWSAWVDKRQLQPLRD